MTHLRPCSEAHGGVSRYDTGEPNLAGECRRHCGVVRFVDGKTGYLCGGYYLHPAKKVTSSQREPFTPDWQLKDPNDPKGMWWLSDGTMCGFRVVCEE